MKKLLSLLALTLPLSCLAEEERIPFAIARIEDRDVIQQALEEADICYKENSQHIAPVINEIDQIIGHDDWGWSCSPDMADLLTVRNIGKEWIWPDQDTIFNAAVSEDTGLLHNLSAPLIDIDWRETSTQGYEPVLELLTRYYDFHVDSGVAFVGWHGRYFEFLPPERTPRHTVNRAGVRCSVLGGAFCFEAFFMIDGMIYPTIMPRGDISRE